MRGTFDSCRERGVLFSPALFLFAESDANTLRLGFSDVNERDIARGVATLADVLRIEMRKKRQRGSAVARKCLACLV